MDLFLLTSCSVPASFVCADLKYRVSIKFFPDYKYLLQENYVEYKHFFKCKSTQETNLSNGKKTHLYFA